jgi:hypothetical protein
MGIVIDEIELLALKKLVIINGALAKRLGPTSAGREQIALTRVLIEVITRADIDNVRVEKIVSQ